MFHSREPQASGQRRCRGHRETAAGGQLCSRLGIAFVLEGRQVCRPKSRTCLNAASAWPRHRGIFHIQRKAINRRNGRMVGFLGARPIPRILWVLGTTPSIRLNRLLERSLGSIKWRTTIHVERARLLRVIGVDCVMLLQ